MTLERRGVATATVVTHVFSEYAHRLCTMQGLETLPIVVIPHPVSARPADELREKVRRAYDDIRKALTGER